MSAIQREVIAVDAPDEARQKASFRDDITASIVLRKRQVHRGHDVHGGEPQGCISERFTGTYPGRAAPQMSIHTA